MRNQRENGRRVDGAGVRASVILLILLSVWLSSHSLALAAEVIIDNRDTSTSQTGTWEASGGTSPFNGGSVWARGGDDTFSWHFTPSQSGSYEVFEWHSTWSTRPTAVSHRITHAAGARTLTVNQKVNGGKWNSLGVYSFVAGVTYTVSVTSTADNSSTCADAVKFVDQSGGSTADSVVIDNGDPRTSFTGVWDSSGAPNPYNPAVSGSTSVWSRDGATYTWAFAPSISGTYELSMWWTQYASRSSSIPVSIESSGGTSTLFINQKTNGGKWNVLGSYPFSAGVSYRVKITSQPGPSSTCADAVRFVYKGGFNDLPVATIQFISPKAVAPGDTVTFEGTGVDGDGSVTAYEWSSDIDGVLSSQSSFSMGFTDAGTRTIFFRVRDNMNAWSARVTALVVVRDCSTPVTIMPLGDSITYGIGEILDPDLTTGYRQPLFQSLRDGGFFFDFVGDRNTGLLVSPPYDVNHQGVRGITADSVADSVYNWLVANPAEIVLLHIGTNGFSIDPGDVAAVLNEIDAYEKDYGVQITVVLAKIINRNPYHIETSSFNENLEAMAEARMAAGDKLVIVDQENALDYPDDLADTFHPRNTGYVKMADVWMNALEDLLPTCSSFESFIYSTPVTSAAVGRLYNYNAAALGNPTPTYALVTAPAGMTMNRSTGRVSWTPGVGQEGAHTVTIQATNSLGTHRQSFSVGVTGVSIETIIDNGDPGTSFSGVWSVSGAPNPYNPAVSGSTSVWSRDGATYTWTFTPAVSGTYALSMWWTQFSSRSTSIPVIIESSAGISTVTINQQVNGGRWNGMGSYDFVAGESYDVTVASQPGPSSTCADAVKFTLVSSAP